MKQIISLLLLLVLGSISYTTFAHETSADLSTEEAMLIWKFGEDCGSQIYKNKPTFLKAEYQNTDAAMKKAFKLLSPDCEIFMKKKFQTYKVESSIESRNAKRMSDLSSIQSGIEQYYQDTAEYPEDISLIAPYISPNNVIPKDPQFKEKWATRECKIGYIYEVYTDRYGIKNGAYRISSCMEWAETIKTKASTDGGIYKNRFELWYFDGLPKWNKPTKRIFINR